MSSKRRSITPALGVPSVGIPPTRRVDGPRHEASDRVTFWIGEEEAMGWSLNVSRSGLRAIVEDAHVVLGATYDIAVGEGPRRPGKIVWVQDEPDGQIVGVAFDLGEFVPADPKDSAGRSGEFVPADPKDSAGRSGESERPSAPAPPGPDGGGPTDPEGG